MVNMKKGFYDLTLNDCMELFTEKGWVFIYGNGEFQQMRIEKRA